LPVFGDRVETGALGSRGCHRFKTRGIRGGEKNDYSPTTKNQDPKILQTEKGGDVAERGKVFGHWVLPRRES